jgi:hypothetical protein
MNDDIKDDMNKRIEELYIKAHIPQEPIRGTARLTKDILWKQADKFDYETFAELIIRECIRIVGFTPTKQDKSWDYVEDIIAEACNDLTEHFGIKDRPVPILTQEEEDFLTHISTSGAFTLEATKKAWE